MGFLICQHLRLFARSLSFWFVLGVLDVLLQLTGVRNTLGPESFPMTTFCLAAALGARATSGQHARDAELWLRSLPIAPARLALERIVVATALLAAWLTVLAIVKKRR